MIELEILAPKEDKPKDVIVTCSSLGDTTPKINLQGIHIKGDRHFHLQYKLAYSSCFVTTV